MLKTREDKLLTPNEVSDLLGIGVHTLSVWRCTGRYSLPFIRIGRRIRYREADVRKWLEEHRDGGGDE